MRTRQRFRLKLFRQLIFDLLALKGQVELCFSLLGSWYNIPKENKILHGYIFEFA